MLGVDFLVNNTCIQLSLLTIFIILLTVVTLGLVSDDSSGTLVTNIVRFV